jgi:hypothetical protein
MGVDLEAAWHEFAAELAALLAPAGIPVTIDPQTLNPPCVLVEPTIPSWPTLSGYDRVAHLEIAVHLLGPPPGDADTTGYLLRHASTVAAAIGAPELVKTTYGAAGLPDLKATVNLVVTEDPAPSATRQPRNI